MAKSKDQSMAEAAAKRTKCPISREAFLEKASPLALKVGEEIKAAGVKEFSSGSYGWYCNEKATVVIDGVSVKVQINASMVIVGSKPAE